MLVSYLCVSLGKYLFKNGAAHFQSNYLFFFVVDEVRFLEVVCTHVCVPMF